MGLSRALRIFQALPGLFSPADINQEKRIEQQQQMTTPVP